LPVIHPSSYQERELKFVALRNTCNILQQGDKLLIISNLSADKILSLTEYCQQFFKAMKLISIFKQFLTH